MNQFAVEEGANAQLSETLDGLFGVNFLAMFLYAGSASFSTSTTLASLTPDWLFAGNLVNPSLSSWTLADGISDVTATLSDQTFNVSGTGGSLTFDGWCIAASEPSFARPSHALLWCGSISPTYTPPNGGGLPYVLSGLTITLGECASPPPPSSVDGLIGYDSFAGSSSITTHVPDYGPSWTLAAGSVSVNNGAFGLTSGKNFCTVPTGTDSYTVTMVLTWNSFDTIQVLFNFADTSNYCAVDLRFNEAVLVSVVAGVASEVNFIFFSPTSGAELSVTLVVSGAFATATFPTNGAMFTTGLPTPSGDLNCGFGIEGNFAVPSSEVKFFRVTTP